MILPQKAIPGLERLFAVQSTRRKEGKCVKCLKNHL